MLEIINNLPTRLIAGDPGCQDDLMSQMLWLIVASAARTLVYHIPECKPYLARARKKCTVPFGFAEIYLVSAQTKAPGHEGRAR
ncbi:hypothetical protein QA641_28865 [Bradyrhizobium sp. CB1650]|uniref:hypothetical protein n=1 Tax=Bradyrhizobium sp. CB1650 TaxID=3039153 RepID=UPI002435ADBE|nr:hypothetical protein [Bradyrhizobium sp. CB1650]WGD49630.1 hypothetical protein QA641_28865 [Bradyrhizobium sp. CB1650]